MSVTINVNPIETETANGTPARITGISMTSGAPFRSTVESAPGVEKRVHWRSNGFGRDNRVGWNLQMGLTEMVHLYETAQKLGARLN